MVQYFDLFVFTLVPIAMQSLAIMYLWKIYHIIGTHMSLLFGGINGAVLLYNITVAYLVITIPSRAAIEARPPPPISSEGLYIGWLMPIIVASLSLILQRKLANVLRPPYSSPPSSSSTTNQTTN